METSLLLQDTSNAASSGRSFLLSADPEAAQQFAATLQQQLDDPAGAAEATSLPAGGLRSGMGNSLRGEIANWLRTLQGQDGVATRQDMAGAESGLATSGAHGEDGTALLLSPSTTTAATAAMHSSSASAQLLSTAAVDGSNVPDDANLDLSDMPGTNGGATAALLAATTGSAQAARGTDADAATDSAAGDTAAQPLTRDDAPQHAEVDFVAAHRGTLQHSTIDKGSANSGTGHDGADQHISGQSGRTQHGSVQSSTADAARSRRTAATMSTPPDGSATPDGSTMLQTATDAAAAVASAETTVAVHVDPAALHPLPDAETAADTAAAALPTTVQVVDYQGTRIPSAPGMNSALRSMGSSADRSSAVRTAAHTSSLAGARSGAAAQTTDTDTTASGAAGSASNSPTIAGSSTAQFAWLERQLGQQFKPEVDAAAVAGLAGDSSTAPQTVLSPEFDATTVQSLQQSAAVLRQGDTQAATRPALSQPFTLQSDVPAGTEGWSEDIGSKVSWLSEQKIGRAELTLHPAELGTLDITINNDDDRVTVSIVTRNEATRELLESSMPRLADLLRSNGMTLEQGSVSHQGSGQREGREAQQGSATARQDGNGGTTQDELRVRQAFLRQGQIDHYV